MRKLQFHTNVTDNTTQIRAPSQPIGTVAIIWMSPRVIRPRLRLSPGSVWHQVHDHPSELALANDDDDDYT
jgi:hypothetical protein